MPRKYFKQASFEDSHREDDSAVESVTYRLRGRLMENITASRNLGQKSRDGHNTVAMHPIALLENASDQLHLLRNLATRDEGGGPAVGTKGS
jgi:hypothetical protein